jgi:hypothetical protein
VCREERGVSGSLELLLGVGLVLFPLVMLIAAIPTWIEARAMGELAAQEAARAMVLADDQASGAATGTAVANQIAANHGYGGAISVGYDGVLDWGETITANVTVEVPVVAIPGIGTFAGTTVTLSHTERVDDYRSFPP